MNNIEKKFHNIKNKKVLVFYSTLSIRQASWDDIVDFRLLDNNNVTKIIIDCFLISNFNLVSFDGLPDNINITLINVGKETMNIIDSLPTNIEKLSITKVGDTPLLLENINNLNINSLKINNIDIDMNSLSNIQTLKYLTITNNNLSNLLPISHINVINDLVIFEQPELDNLIGLPTVKNLLLDELELSSLEGLPSIITGNLNLINISQRLIKDFGVLLEVHGHLTYERSSFSKDFVFPRLTKIGKLELNENTIVKFHKDYKLPNMNDLFVNLTNKGTLKLDFNVLPRKVNNFTIYGSSSTSRDGDLRFKHTITYLPEILDKCSINDILIEVDIFDNQKIKNLDIKGSKFLPSTNNTIMNTLVDNSRLRVLNSKDNELFFKYLDTNDISIDYNHIDMNLKYAPKHIKELTFSFNSNIDIDIVENILKKYIMYGIDIENINLGYTSDLTIEPRLNLFYKNAIKKVKLLGCFYNLSSLK